LPAEIAPGERLSPRKARDLDPMIRKANSANR
jgi:hypothetical protein